MRGAGRQHGAAKAASLVLFFLFAYSGMSKLQDPGATTRFLNAILEAPTPRISIGVLGSFELALSIWLASAWKRRWSGLAAAVIFTVFGVLHGVKAYLGVTVSCGCLGKSSVLADAPVQTWLGISATGILIALFVSRADGARAGGAPAPGAGVMP